ncbi:hypothetical protein [Thermoplasma volcanium GSS1]|uniref:Isopentenyl phosphate kinase n=1 Tax=Thermoplasma volcanium (strain ATCC 51530 / DSM 4299 / JCM 9571 / NBRC 15438 / GSS1) TaxID=273116 RepID=Q97CC1_THEVO|nr:isopentenyl phosphate kinase [Thermoplasma volcanium]BAB59323.1 hypothetical protein [Thermoplasma volcanium GSS1]
MIIIKLGGSLITEKNSYRVFRESETKKAIREIANDFEDFVIIHGGGSFGHIKAKEYGLPGEINKLSSAGFSVVHNDMSYLNHLVVSIMISEGLKPMTVPISSMIFNGNFDYTMLKKYHDLGFVPVSYGDVYVKNNNFYGIYSGDNIVLDLSKIFNPDFVAFLSDVDGIFDKDPKKYRDAKLLRTINTKVEFSKPENDVTGGIENKLNTMFLIRKYTKSVYLINGYYPERLKMIGNDNFTGTVIK